MEKKDPNVYWPDKEDPAGAIDCKNKYDQLALRYAAMKYVALHESGSQHQATVYFFQASRAYEAAGMADQWKAALQYAEIDFLRSFKDTTDHWVK